MRIWEILEIHPTEDTTQIRKAYARLLKIHHPEDDPEGYQQLREAFDMAMRLAKQRFLTDEEEETEKAEMEFAETESEATESVPSWTQPPKLPLHLEPQRLSPIQQVDAFMELVVLLYADVSSRISISSWTTLLNHEIMWVLECQRSLTKRMLSFLNEHYFLPDEVWVLLDHAFGIKELFSSDSASFRRDYPKVIEGLSRNSWAARLSDKEILTIRGIDPEAHLRNCESFALALSVRDLEAAERALANLLPVPDKNPSLLRMIILFYRENVEWEKALQLCREYIDLYPDDEEIPLWQAGLLLDLSRPQEALDLLQSLQRTQTDPPLLLSLLGQCYLRLEQIESAREVYSRMLVLHPGDADAFAGLAKTDALILKGRKRLTSKRKLARQIRKEWGRQSLAVTVKNSVTFLVKSGVLLSLIILLHILFALSIRNNLDLSVSEYLKNTITKPQIPLVLTGEELKAAPPGTAVRLKLTSGDYTGIIRLKDKLEFGVKRPSFILQNEAEANGTINDLEGFIGQTKMDMTSVILLTNYTQALTLYETKFPYEVVGVVQDPSSPEWREFRTYQDDHLQFSYALLKNTVFLNIRDELEGSQFELELPASAQIYMILLLFMYLLLIVYFKKNWRFIRYR
ncbi:J domain-containing protein [Gorillibacterium timonense]|uniref:J domain-containing protein n=1 Tax=Gorillibacterium timonense TaxID=1689269 RepID=UPI00071C9899|nr:J domain-containing protein [Gorillibacterium timonense]